jgi:TonB family protein
MSLLLAALLLAPAVQDAPAAAEEEIVVTARLQTLDVNLQLDRKKRIRSCSIGRSSGDAGFDRTACEATVACARSGINEAAAMRACVRPKLLAYARTRIAKEEQE